MMGWIALAMIGLAAFALLWRLGVSHRLWSFTGAALMLGAAGYALQGRPALPGHPVQSGTEKIDVDPGLIDLRARMTGSGFGFDNAYLMASDGMLRSGDPGAAISWLLGGINNSPKSMVLWTSLGSTLAIHDGNQVSPPALFAFQQAGRLAPLSPAPPFFLGLAYVRAGQFAQARPFWARALALSPQGVSYRKDIAVRLALLDEYLGIAAVAPRPQ